MTFYNSELYWAGFGTAVLIAWIVLIMGFWIVKKKWCKR